MGPMFPATVDKLESVRLPCYLTPIIDGVRCMIKEGKVVDDTLQPLPNKHIQESLAGLPDNLDGHIIIKLDNKVAPFEDTYRAVQDVEAEPEFLFVLSDVAMPGLYLQRYQVLCDTVEMYKNPHTKVAATIMIDSIPLLFRAEATYVKAGYKGVMLRGTNSRYKTGKATLKQGWLSRFSRFDTV